MSGPGYQGFNSSSKTDSSPNTAVKNTPLKAQEYSFPALIHYVSAKKKTTKGDTATVYEILLVAYFPSLNKHTTIIWSIWSSHFLFVSMLDQMNRESTIDRPLLLYTDNGSGKNSMYELLLMHSNKYSTFCLDNNEDIQHTAQAIMKYEDKSHSGRPPINDDFFRVVPWKSYPDNRMGPNPEEWLQIAISDEAKISVEDAFEFPQFKDEAINTPTNSKKRK